mgnify:CR=1 FL=1
MNDLRKWRRFWIVSNVVFFAAVLLLGQMVEGWQFHDLRGNAGVLFAQRSLWPRDQGDAGCLGDFGADLDDCYAAGTLADWLGAALCAWLLRPGRAYGGL